MYLTSKARKKNRAAGSMIEIHEKSYLSKQAAKNSFVARAAISHYIQISLVADIEQQLQLFAGVLNKSMLEGLNNGTRK